ncbi:hypothetical protein NHF48_000030 [Sphingomonas sp. H160509]|uniref:hypothetical protein n=1 Tax=Sphingomonas sp. H160509 TaxID=2955313 RepID=UPI002097116F|nr:hypothetical protein [Sphingomonas sp. H160509]MDD1449661.1 hypothetical protein [Sphingomonas sp. H160509]
MIALYAATVSGGLTARRAILDSRYRASVVDAVFAGAMTAHRPETNDFITSAYVQPRPVDCARDHAGRWSTRTMLSAILAGYELAGLICAGYDVIMVAALIVAVRPIMLRHGSV